MANSKLIVIEGAQGAGKTTITDYLRNSIKYTNLYRLCGTSDSTPSGLQKAVDMYTVLLEYIKKLENKSINLLFDRTFFTEENYCRLGKKEYSFTEAYNTFLENFANLDFEIYYITLYLEDENQYNERIKRDGKCEPEYAKFKAENSIEQQRVYLEMAEEIKEKYPKIKVLNIANDRDIEIVKKELKEFIEF
jgi:thymidylate kinase